jgi:antitoxin component YwqK of YwqJK toxin-antitoxin module
LVNGRPNGDQIEWYENGNIKKKGSYAEGARDGTWIMWYSNGNKRGETTLSNGRPDGMAKEWYSNGSLKNEGHYIDGRRIGPWKYWTEGNELQKVEYYEKGVLRNTEYLLRKKRGVK